MKYTFDAIKIDEKILSINTEEVSRMYMIKMDYESLIELCGVGKVSINRVVDTYRSGKMKNYIREKNAFYPPLIVATTKKNLIIYDVEKKTIRIDEEKLIKNKDMLVIDGQHRYTSIKMLKEEDRNLISNRYQAIFLIDNLNEFQQRKTFIDINDNAKKVTTGTRLRLDKTLINYISLSIVDNCIGIQKRISMDGNQTVSLKKIPYKFIIRGNEKLVKKIDDDYDRNKIDIAIVDKILSSLYIIWDEVFKIVDLAEEKQCNIVINEVFFIAVCIICEGILIEDIYNKVLNKVTIDKIEFKKNISSQIDKIMSSLDMIDKLYYEADLNRAKEKYEKIVEIINGI